MNNNFKSYDLVIIGSGPGGYISAIRANHFGLRTAIIEKNKNFLGGTCLNTGCIPSKCLLDSSKNFFIAKKNFSSHGIFFEKLKFDLNKIINRKNKTIENINNGIKYLMRKNNIDIYNGIGYFNTKNILSIKDHESMIEKHKIQFKNCIISTGSFPLNLSKNIIKKNYYNDNELNNKIITSTKALNMNKIPKKLITIGGGFIGLELSSVFSRLGSEVIIIDSMDRIIPNMDHSISNEMKKILEKSSIKIKNSLFVQEIEILEKSEEILVSTIDNSGNKFSFNGNCCLISIGRIPYTSNLGLENIGIKKDNKGFIIVDKNLQTTINNIYAIGDVIGGKMLAHKAEEEGLYVVEHIIGNKPNILNYNLIPSIIYTYPEVSSVGYTEYELKENKIEYNIGNFPMKALGRARSSGCIDGFIKMISDKKTDEILGVHIISEFASDIIMEAVVAMEFNASSEDIYRICHPHPTFSESYKEVSLMNFENKSIHI
ncbi:dihydrolipoyl dehydrogenase [Blattabacterium cuenoti]|uniref:dihydrolipoyl dehydrogenase n=1 Tax=Blattabacterium cuenoti TaxID=1653831 RepID=UPI00163CC8B6|nr:dihydrolipoyl dehydrogenase [Blattabacterium cuenoti]